MCATPHTCTCDTCVCSLGCTVYYTCREYRKMRNTGIEETQGTGGKEGVHMEKTQGAWGRKGAGATDLQRTRQEHGEKG